MGLEGGAEAAALDAAAGCGVLAEQVEGESAQEGEGTRRVPGAVADPDAAAVLAEGQVGHPVDAVLDAPVAADRRSGVRAAVRLVLE